jgi:hypothetical protein
MCSQGEYLEARILGGAENKGIGFKFSGCPFCDCGAMLTGYMLT